MSGVAGMVQVNKRSRNTNLHIFRHKVYILSCSTSKDYIKARLMTPALYTTVPRTFVWKPRSDVDGCKAYVDALLGGRTSVADYYEKNGYVTEVVMPDPQMEVQKVRVNIKGFVDWLLMRGHIDIPLHHRVLFITDGAQFIPRDFIASIAPLLTAQGEENSLGSPDNWHRMTTEEEAKVGPESLSLGRNYVEQSVAEPVAFDDQLSMPDEAAEPAEIEVRRRRHEKHADMLTKVYPGGQRPYFARRLIDYRGHMLWVGSAWEERGPWRVTQRDTSRMLALGISEPV